MTTITLHRVIVGSETVTATRTVRDIVTSALQKAGVLAWGENAPAEDASAAMIELDSMLKSWQNMGYNLWTKTSGSLTLTTAASYTLSPERPMRILSARFKQSNNELPMIELTRDEYDTLPLKTSTGTPTQFYYDRQRENALLYVWPVLATASGETIEYTYDREINDVRSLDDVIDVPGEWWEAVIYNLAVRISETVPIVGNAQALQGRAALLLHDAQAFDREGSVFFGGAI